MTVKEWLSRAQNINKAIDALIDERDKAFAEACKITAPPSDVERVSGTHDNATENKFTIYAEYTRMIDVKIDELYATKNEILAAIDAVNDNTYRALLTRYYVNGETWEQIAEELNYSVYWTRSGLHDRALAEVEKHKGGVIPRQ